MGSLGAVCFHTLKPDRRNLTKQEWDLAREGMLCTTAASFANWKEAILKLCHDTKECQYEQAQQFFKTIERLP